MALTFVAFSVFCRSSIKDLFFSIGSFHCVGLYAQHRRTPVQKRLIRDLAAMLHAR